MDGAVHERRFRAMGSEIRLVVGARLDAALPVPERAAAEAEAWLHAYDERLSRFRADSELSRLNADPRDVVPASPLLRLLVRAGLLAAEQSGGLVDPCLLDALEAAGYRDSRSGAVPAPLAEALAAAPPRAPARPRPRAPWRALGVDDDAGTVTRPPGLRIDSGGVGKGLAADLLAARFERYARFAIDCGGDLRVGGRDAAHDPFAVEVEHPLAHEPAHALGVAGGGVATSALTSRVWRDGRGGFAHHLLDPATGRPAWTGVLSATALAPTAVAAETRSKTALLSGPDAAREQLREHGGVLVLDDGSVEALGAAALPRLRLRADRD